MSIYIATIHDQYPRTDIKRDVYQGPSKDAAKQALELALQDKYPNQWQAANDKQYMPHGLILGDVPLGVIYEQLTEPEVRERHILNWQRKIQLLRSELAEAETRLAEWINEPLSQEE